MLAFMYFSCHDNGNLTTMNVSKVVTSEKSGRSKQNELTKATPICKAPTKKEGACKIRFRYKGIWPRI